MFSYSGTEVPRPFTSSSNILILTFTSDAFVTNQGFLADVTGMRPIKPAFFHHIHSYEFICRHRMKVSILYIMLNVAHTKNSGSRFSNEPKTFCTKKNHDLLLLHDDTRTR